MVEHTRPHPRLAKQEPKGRRLKLQFGTLFLPEKLRLEGKLPLFIHFHGSAWLPEVAAAQNGKAVISVQLGSGAGVYGRVFPSTETFSNLLKEAASKAGVTFEPVGLTAWSAGYGAVREILKTPAGYERVQFVLLQDGLHAGYQSGKPGPKESQLIGENLTVFVKFGKDAVAGKKADDRHAHGNLPWHNREHN
jgi:hypothetical protein